MQRHVMRGEPDGLTDLLRREAARERPTFSEALHARMVRRLPAAPTASRLAEPLAKRAGWSVRGAASLVSAAAALAAVVVAVVGARPDPADDEMPLVAFVAADRADGGEVTAAGGSAAAAEFGIDQVPTFDELEEVVGQGVSTLAVALLDVPEWRMLADFDAAGFLGADSAP